MPIGTPRNVSKFRLRVIVSISISIENMHYLKNYQISFHRNPLLDFLNTIRLIRGLIYCLKLYQFHRMKMQHFFILNLSVRNVDLPKQTPQTVFSKSIYPNGPKWRPRYFITLTF